MRELLQAVPADLVYVSLLAGILLVPKLLQGTHVPGPVWALLLGLLVGMTLPEHSHDPVISLLATLGIASLFLFAGLEVEVKELRSAWRPLVVHLAARCVGLVIVAVLAVRWKGFDPWAAGLLALALLTPSTGFILDTLARLGLSDETQFWIKSKAIAGELLALFALFLLLKSGSGIDLMITSAWLALLIVALPVLFIGFARWVLPHAPGSEFSFLIVVGVVAAYATKQLGVYYLVGAFIAGFVARQLTHRVPELGAHDTMNALKLFAGFFVPFYFFHAGQGIPPEAISWDALGVGLGFTAVLLPLRVGAIVLHRVLHLREPWLDAVRVAMPLSPTLIFTMVIATILYEDFGIPATLYGGLLVYAVMSTLIPALVKQDVELDLTEVRRRTT
ncbi:MAG: cation:proton antiporter [Burkholderiaceae bacterium]|jgi:Kef-type K+ transport system membrane component KefB|nr:cation:proton antiporter [Burkholderiaceae bacterium]MDH5208388.1 cation:proton antiporter [Burkholderiaceae bacterium]